LTIKVLKPGFAVFIRVIDNPVTFPMLFFHSIWRSATEVMAKIPTECSGYKNRVLILCSIRCSEYNTEQGPLSLIPKCNVISRAPSLGLELIKIGSNVLKIMHSAM
jgi:hypothetical protein